MTSLYIRTKVIMIQSAYRGYILRRRINLYKKLPMDVWNRVLYYVKYQHHIQHEFKDSILNIYDNKILDCDEEIIEFHQEEQNGDYNIIFSLRAFALKGYFTLIKFEIINMFRRYSMILY